MNLFENSLVLSKSELAALLAFASTDETRAHIFGVALDPISGCIFSTDGHRLLSYALPLTGKPAVMSRADLERVQKAAGPKEMIRLEITADGVLAHIGAASLPVRFTGATPPAAAQVIPEYDGSTARALSCGLSPAYLADLAKVAKAIGGDAGLRLQFGPNDLDPTLALFTGDENWSAVIMPRRIEGKGEPVRYRAKLAGPAPVVTAVAIDLAALPEAELEAPAVVPAAPAVVPIVEPAAAVAKPARVKPAARQPAPLAKALPPTFKSLGRVRQRAA